MKSALTCLIAVLVLLLSPQAHSQTAGTWSATGQKDDQLQMNLHHGNSRHGNRMPLADLSGLSTAQIGSANAQVEFRLEREAGTVTFRGVFSNGSGAGQFSFQANPSYLSRLEAAGVDTRGKDGKPAGESKLLSLALLDVSSQLARDLQSLGFNGIRLNELAAVRIHGATPEFIRGLRAGGYEDLSLEEAVASRIHGVSPDFAREVRQAGVTASLKDLVAMRIHGASVEWLSEFRNLGYQLVDVDDFIALRIHGVSPQFVRDIAGLGYRDVPPKDLVAMRIHGVTPEFIREVQARGDSPTIRKLISMKIHGVEASARDR